MRQKSSGHPSSSDATDHGEYAGYSSKLDEPARGQEKDPGKLVTAAKAFRAVTAIVVFGIPLVTGTAALLTYGIRKAYQRIIRK